MKIATVKTIVIAVVAVAAIATGVWFGQGDHKKPVGPFVQDTVITILPKAKVLKPFELQTGAGEKFSLQDLKGRYTLFFFGYTSCPDVCPTTLVVLKNLYANLEKDKRQENYQVVFVSVDPRRDTPARLEEYVAYFNKTFIAATGKPDNIANLARQLGARYEIEGDGKSKDYSISHTGAIFVIDPDAQYAAVLTPPLNASRIETRLALLEQVEKQGSNK